jgi:hypothetical protein
MINIFVRLDFKRYFEHFLLLLDFILSLRWSALRLGSEGKILESFEAEDVSDWTLDYDYWH